MLPLLNLHLDAAAAAAVVVPRGCGFRLVRGWPAKALTFDE